MKLFGLLLGCGLSQTLDERVAILEDAVMQQHKEIDQLKQRLTKAETEITVLESSLTCGGSAFHDVCGCASGYAYYQGECVPSDEAAARAWIEEFNVEYQFYVHDASDAYFTYETNITDTNLAAAGAASARFGAWYSAHIPHAIRVFDWKNFEDPLLKRQFSKLLGNSNSLNAEDSAALSNAMNNMNKIYASGTVGDADRCVYLEGAEEGGVALEGIMANSLDYNERLWSWLGWRTNVGDALRPHFETYVEMKNKWAQVNGFEDYGQYWRSDYEMPDDNFNDMAVAEYEKIEPLYVQLHAYVRYRLGEVFGNDIFDQDSGLLPANVLGDMWGRFWTGLNQFVVPYPDAPDVDVTEELKAQGYDAKKMFELSDDFFKSLGLERVNEIFWDKSVIERIPDVEMVCHPTAWDLGNGEDFRIKMCTDINMDYLLTIHHEMGHIQYDMQYAWQPPQFRDGGNEGFHEAMGEVMAMNVATPEHLRAIGLLGPAGDEETEYQTTINFLMFQALQQVATMPFTIMMENWRYASFNESITTDEWMEKFWQMKNEWVGVKAPAERTEKSADPAALYHIANDYSMMRYYSRTIYQFQFQKVLCDACGHTGPLYTCDVYQCEAAGDKLKILMGKGSSQYWLDQLHEFTGDDEATMNADGMRDYYQPLMDWLVAENARLGITPGWDASKTEYHPFDENMDFIGKCAENNAAPSVKPLPFADFIQQYIKA